LFTPAGHFAISKEGVWKRDRNFYKRILDILSIKPSAPYEIERLESYIFL
jgi:hypothetical protein